MTQGLFCQHNLRPKLTLSLQCAAPVTWGGEFMATVQNKLVQPRVVIADWRAARRLTTIPGRTVQVAVLIRKAKQRQMAMESVVRVKMGQTVGTNGDTPSPLIGYMYWQLNPRV